MNVGSGGGAAINMQIYTRESDRLATFCLLSKKRIHEISKCSPPSSLWIGEAHSPYCPSV